MGTRRFCASPFPAAAAEAPYPSATSSAIIRLKPTAKKAGLYFTRGDNKRLPGWMQCHRRLRFDENGRAGMYVFSNCEQFIRTIPLLRYSRTDPEDADSSGEDHIADEWRYACMSRPLVPVIEKEERIPVKDPLDRW